MAPQHTPAPSPARSIYGFVLYLLCYTALALYLVWAYVPEEYLNAVGLTYWPQKYWAVAVPAFVCVSIFVFATCLYPAVSLLLTAPLDAERTITDRYARTVKASNVNGCIPPISDIPIGDVCHHLYLR